VFRVPFRPNTHAYSGSKAEITAEIASVRTASKYGNGLQQAKMAVARPA
jgi:hypothetical protein